MTTDRQQVIAWCTKLVQEDHLDHEAILRDLQDAADPFSIPFLRQAVLLKPRLTYLTYDDYGAYYKRCFWALAAIGTPEALATIREFTTADDPVMTEQARYRLSRIAGNTK